MSATEVQWIGSSCGRHGSYTFYKGFRINSHGTEKNFCLGQFYLVRNSDDKPICVAELQLIWHDSSNDSKLASARLYFKPENTPFGRLSIHGEDELLYADEKVIIKCEDMVQWEYKGKQWITGLIPLQESDFIPRQFDTCIDQFTGKSEHKYKLQQTSIETADKDIPTEKIIILTFQAYCRYKALQKRLMGGMMISKSNLSALGGVVATSKSTRVVFCRECFSCPDLENFHLSGENKAPVLKGRPRKKRIRSSTLAKELKRKRFLADLERVKNNLPSKKIKLSESEEGTESDLSEESTKSSESMDEVELPKSRVEAPIHKTHPPNGLLPMSVKKVVMVTHINDKTKAPPPLIPTTKLKTVTSPPPLHKVKIKPEVAVVTRLDSGPPPLCPISKQPEASTKPTNLVAPLLLSKTKPETSRPQLDPALHLSSSKGYTIIKSTPTPTSSSATSSSIVSKPDAAPCHGVKAMEPLSNVDRKAVMESRSVGIVKMEGKENLQDANKTKKKRLRQPTSMREFNEDTADDDEKYFMRSLREFMKSRETPISKIPALGFKRVNLWTMYKTAQKLGGYDMVTSKRLWRQVYDALGGSTTITSAATYTRRHYERLLLPYERFVRGQLNAKKSGPQQTPKAVQDFTDSKEQTSHPNTNNSSATNKINAASIKDNVSRITVNNTGNASSVSKESLENKEIPGVTSTVVSRVSLNTVVKVKPNGAIPPYSVSIQSAKKDGVTPSTIIVTKSVNVPVSSTQSTPRNSLSSTQSTPRNSSTPASTKSAIPVTSQVSQRRNDVTASVTPHQANSVNPPSSHSVIVNRPVRSPVSTARVSSNKVYMTSSLVTQKQSTQVNGRDVTHTSQSTNYKIGNPVVPEEQTKLHKRYVSELEYGQGKHSQNKYGATPVAEKYDHSCSQTANKKLPVKCVIEDVRALESSSMTEKESHYKQDGMSRVIPLEPPVKRRKTPSPCHTIPQHQYLCHVDKSSNISHATTHTSRHATPSPHVTSMTPQSRNTVSDCSRGQERIVHADLGQPDIYDHSSLNHRSVNSHSKVVVDLTTEIEAQSQSSTSLVHHRTSSPLYAKVPHSYQQDHVINTCQRTEPRIPVSNSRHLSVTQPQDCHIQRNHHNETTQKHNHNLTDSKALENTYVKREIQTVEFDPRSVNAEGHRTVTQRTSMESPDAHFQEWRRRQGMSEYPAYITTNPTEPRRGVSLAEHPLPLHPQTPPLEHRFVYVQEDNGMPPRVIEEVPLILSSKPGMYYPEDSFYGTVPFYHSGWPAAGVEGSFNGDAEMIRNNNHLRSSSCIFMPTSQMFGSAAPMTPISPPIVNQGHVSAGPEAMHPHCLMTSPYAHNRVMVSQTPTRTLHSFT